MAMTPDKGWECLGESPDALTDEWPPTSKDLIGSLEVIHTTNNPEQVNHVANDGPAKGHTTSASNDGVGIHPTQHGAMHTDGFACSCRSIPFISNVGAAAESHSARLTENKTEYRDWLGYGSKNAVLQNRMQKALCIYAERKLTK